jgi:hypothetical protein
LLVNDDGKFNGSGSWFIPWNDNNRYLSWSQFGVTQQTDGLVSNAGVGQRWIAGKWLLGYNTFYDNLLDENLQRAGLGAEAWGENLRLSANYYQPFASWRDSSDVQEQRMARGYDVTAKAWLPWFHHLNTSVSFEQYFGDNVDLFNTGTGYHNPVAVNLGLNYTPVPLVTLTAAHKQGESGVSQNNLGLKLNYRFGVPLKADLCRRSRRHALPAREPLRLAGAGQPAGYGVPPAQNVISVSGDATVGSERGRDRDAEATNSQHAWYSSDPLAG